MTTVCQLMGRIALDIRHMGIILSVIFSVMGAALLAFSLRVKSDGGWRFGDVSPTETYINKWLFWSGLVLIAAGALMQLLQW